MLWARKINRTEINLSILTAVFSIEGIIAFFADGRATDAFIKGGSTSWEHDICVGWAPVWLADSFPSKSIRWATCINAGLEKTSSLTVLGGAGGLSCAFVVLRWAINTSFAYLFLCIYSDSLWGS